MKDVSGTPISLKLGSAYVSEDSKKTKKNSLKNVAFFLGNYFFLRIF